MQPRKVLRRLLNVTMSAAQDSKTKVERIIKNFVSLPPGTRELVAKNYVDALITAILEEKAPKPTNRYEMLMSDDDGVDS